MMTETATGSSRLGDFLFAGYRALSGGGEEGGESFGVHITYEGAYYF